MNEGYEPKPVQSLPVEVRLGHGRDSWYFDFAAETVMLYVDRGESGELSFERLVGQLQAYLGPVDFATVVDASLGGRIIDQVYNTHLGRVQVSTCRKIQAS